MLVRTITRQGFKLESPFLHRMCILGPSEPYWKWVIDLDLQGHLRQMFTLSYLRNGLIDWHRRKLFWSMGNREELELNMRIIEHEFESQLWSYFWFICSTECWKRRGNYIGYWWGTCFLPLGLKGRRGIVVTSVCLSVRLSVCLSVRLSVTPLSTR